MVRVGLTTRRRGLVAMALFVVLVACDAPVTPSTTAADPSDHGPTPRESWGAGVVPSAPDSVGTVTPRDGGRGGCPDEFTCRSVTVECPGAPEPAVAQVATRGASAAGGTVLLLSGGSGQTWWAADGPRDRLVDAVDELVDAGLRVVQVRWPDGWAAAPDGLPVGPRAMACRPAALVWHLALDGHATRSMDGPCHPLCASGNSGGASQLAYALADHRAGEVLDHVVLTSGPPHAALADGCLPAGADRAARRYEAPAARGIDQSYGHLEEAGPCARGDVDFAARWRQDAVGPPSVLPTSLTILLGAEDATSAPSHVQAWLEGGVAGARVVEVPAMGHHVQRSPEGLAILVGALTGDGSARTG